MQSSVTDSPGDRGINQGNITQVLGLEPWKVNVECRYQYAILPAKPVIFPQKLDFELTALKIEMEEDK